MNTFIAIGRFTTDPDMRKSAAGLDIASFILAVDRAMAKEGEKKTDFIPCVAFGKLAITIGKYFHKGSKIAIQGQLNIDSVKKDDGSYNNFTKIIVHNIDFLDKRSDTNNGSSDDNAAYVPSPEDDANVPF